MMIPPIEGQDRFPSRCPFPSCRAKIHREWVLGVMPKFLGMINVVIRCNSCKRVYAITMPVMSADEFKRSLSSDPDFPVKLGREKRRGKAISSTEIEAFGESLKGDGEEKMLEAFAILDEYDALGYDGNEDSDDL